VDDFLTRIWENLIGRTEGPLTLRLFLQPTMATIFAVRDGLKDARAGQPAYFWSLFTDPAGRRERLLEARGSVAKVFALAIILDAIYQYKVLRWFYPGEALLVALILAFLPYLLIRGPVNRLARLWSGKAAAADKLQ